MLIGYTYLFSSLIFTNQQFRCRKSRLSLSLLKLSRQQISDLRKDQNHEFDHE